MFSTANYIAAPIVSQIFEPNLFKSFMMTENILAGIFAVVGGFVADYIGRRRLVLAGFVLLGVGYASLGLFSENIVGWWFYTITDGVAWGIFYTIFLQFGETLHIKKIAKNITQLVTCRFFFQYLRSYPWAPLFHHRLIRLRFFRLLVCSFSLLFCRWLMHLRLCRFRF